MSRDTQRMVGEPIGISVVVGAMMLVMLSHAAHSIFAWLSFAGALVGLVLINVRYRALMRAVDGEPGVSPFERSRAE